MSGVWLVVFSCLSNTPSIPVRRIGFKLLPYTELFGVIVAIITFFIVLWVML